MKKQYIEFRNRSGFGDIINNYFLFLKYNFKEYSSLYLRYNAVSIVLTIIASYLLVTGFMGLASRDFRFGMGTNIETEGYFFGGMIILLLIIFVTSLINYSFSSAYVVDYVNNNGKVESKSIWKQIKRNIGDIIILVIVGALMYFAYLIISVMISFIPFLGFIAQYAMSFTLSAIFGLTFMSMFSRSNGFSQAISEGFNFTFNSFLKVIGYGLVIGILNLMVTALILAIPGFLIGIYTYFSVENNIELVGNTFATLVFTFGFIAFILSFIYTQALTQVAFGVLYYNLFELKHNTYLQQKINQIGVNEQL
ncbi:hypothetical protein DFQ05_1940 [Winogradskyella wandonensis]|uniref:Glycerophosphoryl diester phosphodiesterase family protein n=1 Tax=Winogradskyella wandonensis TaxID=1442586 RepID=A0A4R1KQ86_9FLAO|nr:hypothetical protein [Winogradskyella wandonensis]TCK66667.1 hypothetical protein DFQ05_1940 [Winogradskyella wandonensis]